MGHLGSADPLHSNLICLVAQRHERVRLEKMDSMVRK